MTELKNIQRRRITEFITHAIVIVAICILPEMLMRMSSPMRSAIESWWLYSKSWIMIAVFYTNYFIIIDRTLVIANKRWKFVMWNILLIAVAAVLMHYINDIGIEYRRGPRNFPPRDQWQIILAHLSFVLRDGMMLLMVVSLAVVLRLSHKWQEMEQLQQELIATRRESELESLRMQLSPHFLFNTLNNIYALIEIAPSEAQKTVHQLSQMLRYVVYKNPERVELSQEIEFVQNYIDLMRLRMSNRPIEINIHNEAPDATIAPLLFVALIENAFKHGNTPDSSNPIKINLHANSREIEFSTENHVDQSTNLDESHGVGLTNLHRRIELIYDKSASLETSLTDGIFRAKLHIDICEN